MESSKLETMEKQRKALYEAYTYFIDPSTIIQEHYKKKDFHGGQQKYLHKINKWINEQVSAPSNTNSNKPLVFRTEPGVGVKTLLVNWEKQFLSMYANKKQKCLTIMHFASSGSNNSNYFYSLYRIIIKLREALKLKQNVDLLQEKIRNYFPYWLDLCNSELQRQLIINCAQEIYDKIIIVIEGVDRFIDAQSGEQANLAFWLPESFPKNIKVIVTASRNSDAIQHLEKLKCQIIDIQPCDQISNALIQKATTKQTILNQQTQIKLRGILVELKQSLSNLSGLYSLIDVYCDCLMPVKQNQRAFPTDVLNVIKQVIEKKTPFFQLKKVANLKDLYKILIKIWTQHLPLKGRADLALKYLVLTQKGLTKREIIVLTRLSEKQWLCFQMAIGGLLTCFEGLYSIKSSSFSAVVLEGHNLTSQHEPQPFLQFHEKIATALELTPNSIRKLEQQTYHLFVSKSYFKLKEVISNIENFLLLFNPNNKYELSRYWQKLEEKGFDPVIQYNKAVEGFSMHFHPSDENIFRIIVQISRFLKEFCDFQTYETPNFRHPYIEGNKSELQRIGLLKQLSDLQIYVDNSFTDQAQTQDCTLQEEIRQLRQKYFPKQAENLQGSISVSLNQNPGINKSNIFSGSSVKQRRKTQIKILSDIEQLNVDVPMNREKFRNYYLKGLQEFMKNQQCYGNNIRKHSANEQQKYFDVEQQKVSINAPQNINYSFNKVRQNYRLRPIKPSLYYYKRWIWIQFPWVCISLQNNYSNTPELFCGHNQNQKASYTADDGEMLQKQAKYTKLALIIAIEAKQKKKQMFLTSKGDNSAEGNENSSSVSRFRSTINNVVSKDRDLRMNMTSSKFGNSQFRSRTLKGVTPPDLSLAALTKELQIRKKQLRISQKIGKQNQIQLMEGMNNANVNQNPLYCENDMKFIKKRKQFHQPDLNEMESNEMLPKVKWMIKEHTNYEMQYIQSNIEEKKKKLNGIIFENKKLSESYKQLKLKENLNRKNESNVQGDSKICRKNRVLEELLHKKEEVIRDFCKSVLQKERLKIILKLCCENKTRNEQYLSSLNYLLQNIRKMINWERQNMKGINEELEQIKVLQERKIQIEQQQQKNQQIVKKEANNYLDQKKKLEAQIHNITSIISDDIRHQKHKLQSSLSGHIKSRQQKNFAILQDKKAKQLQEKLDKVQAQYKALQILFQFQGFDFENAPKFKVMLQENQRNKKLKIAYFQRKNKLQELIREHEKLKQQNKKQIENAGLNRQKFKKENTENQTKQNDAKSASEGSSKLKIFLDNIAMKLNVRSRQQIIPILNRKLLVLKQSKKDKYLQILDPNFKPYEGRNTNRFSQY